MQAKWKLALCNAAIGAMIGFVASLPAHIPNSLYSTIDNLYGAAAGAILTFLIQLKPLIEKEAEDEERIEDRRLNIQIAEIQDTACDDIANAKTDSANKKKPRIGNMLWWLP